MISYSFAKNLLPSQKKSDRYNIMKGFQRLLMLVVGFFAVGCQTDNIADNAVDTAAGVSRETTTLTISISQTRTSLGEKVGDTYPVYWSEGDRIVVNGLLSNEAEIDAENVSRANFEFAKESISYPYHITYPYCAATTAGQPMVEFPAEQNYSKGTS